QDVTAYPMYVHCDIDRDRTAVAFGLYRVRVQGWSPAAAWAEAERFGLRRYFVGLNRYLQSAVGAPRFRTATTDARTLSTIVAPQLAQVLQRLIHRPDHRPGHPAGLVQFRQHQQVVEIGRGFQLLPLLRGQCPGPVVVGQYVLLDQELRP